jgi:SNF2 family DNA or RNA helicase
MDSFFKDANKLKEIYVNIIEKYDLKDEFYHIKDYLTIHPIGIFNEELYNKNTGSVTLPLKNYELEKIINKNISSCLLFFDIIKLNIFNLLMELILKSSHMCDVTLIKFNNIKTLLYDYQKNNVNWMINIENKIYPFDITNINNNNLARGGGIFDEVGMGKTLQSITLINQNKSKNNDLIKNNKFKSKATLIIVPNHLCGQWLREFEKHCIKPLKIINLLTKHHLKKFSYFDLINCDIIIVSSRYFINCNIDQHQKIDKSFIAREILNKNVNIFDIFWHRIIIDEFHEIESTNLFIKLKFLESDYRWLLSGTPFKEQKINDLLTLKNSSLGNFFDYLTYDTNSLFKIDYVKNYEYVLYHFSRNLHCHNLKELKLPIVKEETVFLHLTQTERMIYNAHLSNTNNRDDDIFLRQICCHPLIAETVRNIISNNVTSLEDIQVVLKQMYFGEYEKALELYNKCLEKINILSYEIKDMEKNNKTDLIMYRTSKEDLKNNEIKLIELDRIKIGKKKSLQYYEDFIELISNTDKIEQTECAICLSEINRNDIGITFCAHIYCYSCISAIIKEANPKCPCCSKHLEINKIFSINESKNDFEDCDDKLRNECGTKLAHIINYIKSTPDKYRIIFSQWDYLLKEVGKVLTKNNIKNIYCSGNVYQKDKALKLFNSCNDNSEDNIKVIMLSSETSASGSNLSNAEEVILLDPAYGDKQIRLNIERQAIGRVVRLGNKHKEIKVIRLIMKNTIEEDIYKSNIN